MPTKVITVEITMETDLNLDHPRIQEDIARIVKGYEPLRTDFDQRAFLEVTVTNVR